MNKKYNIKDKKEDKKASEITLFISVEPADLDTLKNQALESLGQGVKLPGFRPGKIPTAVLEEKVGRVGILEEEINIWLKNNLRGIIADEKIAALSMPRITIKKIVPDNPVEIELTFPVKPKFTLPDYKKIASEINKKYKNEVKLDDAEVENALTSIKQYLNNLNKKTKQNEQDTEKDENQTISENPEKQKDTETTQDENDKLPELTDESVSKISPFKTVSEFMDNLKKNMLTDKKRKIQEKNRAEIIDAILKNTEIWVPETMIQNELDQMLREFEDNITKMGMKFDEYLKNAKKTVEELRVEWQEMAKKRVQSELLIRQIAEEEKTEPNIKEVEKEINHILEHNKNLDKDDVSYYVKWILKKEEALKLLETV